VPRGGNSRISATIITCATSVTRFVLWEEFRLRRPWGRHVAHSNRVAIMAMATAGLFCPVLMLGPTATADSATSPEVPCLDIVQQFAASPPSAAEGRSGCGTHQSAARSRAGRRRCRGSIGRGGPPRRGSGGACGASARHRPAGGDPARDSGRPGCGHGGRRAAPAAGWGGTAAGGSAGAMPDIGLPLPSSLPIPTDLVCEGTAWPAHRDSDGHVGAASAVGRRDQW
jgi:hypothetical protein